MIAPRIFSRRNVVAAAAGLGLTIPFLARPAAADDGMARRKLVVVICRGGMDGLSVAPPLGDRAYAGLRANVALGEEALPLDGDFALHPALASVHALAGAGQARIAPAIATPDRARSHFEAQDVLESGGAVVYGVGSGWLNRALEALSPKRVVKALSIGATTPLIMRGPAPAGSWSPGRTVDAHARLPALLQDLYRADPLLGPALARGLANESMIEAAGSEMMMSANPESGPQRLRQGAEAARGLDQTLASFMRAPEGPQVAALSLDGFDTHANQGAAQGQLAARLGYLDAVVDGLHRGLGQDWRDTVVLVVTEFGRTARVNGAGGTDHGTASTALVLGGGLKPGGIVGDWPGLAPANLYEGRDLAPTLDMRGLFKGVLAEQLGVTPSALESNVFPDSADAPPVRGLVA